MRIEVPHHTERLGAVRIHGVQEVFELDSGVGPGDDDLAIAWRRVRHVPHDVINAVERRMAIVVPCRSERLKVLDGVLSGIPHDCLVILVSNSPREPIDRYKMEKDTVTEFSRHVQRNAVMIHQRDPGLANAFREAGLPEIVDDEGLVRDGKGEGMLVGMAVAKLAGRDWIGFIDADNYVPGAVNEYVKAYAAGFHLAQTPYAMVRISWRSKPKIQDGRLFFNRWGRTSQITNHFLNLVLAEYSGFGTDIVTTGNAGEHGLSLDLALNLQFAGGFAVEPYEYLNLFEFFGGVVPSPNRVVMQEGVEVFQIETRNPHFHEDKGSGHVQEMRLRALNVLFHSPICPRPVRDEIVEFLREQDQLGEEEQPPREIIYPPLGTMDWDTFMRVLVDKSESFEQTEIVVPTTVVFTSPIDISAPDVQPPPSPGGAGVGG